jgi:hypothetical protein
MTRHNLAKPSPQLQKLQKLNRTCRGDEQQDQLRSKEKGLYDSSIKATTLLPVLDKEASSRW